ncbi:MAG: septal ring lytic transglycosylase RlpA family protein [Ignavibacteriaceae bacterium]|nr:septal ring lytic transglycosylase RlpA family protein [Ignavibacteriaceae bacterium]
MKSLAIVFFMIVIGGLVGFTVINNEKKENSESILIEELVPETIKESTVNTSSVDYINLGTMKASWYGPKFHGKLTANGEIYDQMALTAAHKTLKFGTLLKVTNPKNGKSVIIRINDRGPYIGDRELDLSKGSAIKLGLIEKGVSRVKIQEVTPGEIENPTALVN